MLAAGVAAQAAVGLADLPPLKEGLWLTTINNEGMKPQTHRICVDRATLQRVLLMGQGMMFGMCRKSEIQRSGNAITHDSDCSMGPMRMRSTGRTTFTSDAAYRTESTNTFDPPLMGRATTRTVAEGRHGGACPAGMKPGDMTLPDGRTLNINNLPSLIQPVPR